jgi:hypothetical protein
MITFFGLIGFLVLLMVGVMMFLPVALGTLLFSQPVECRMGQDCWIQNYVDVDPSGQWSDYRCGHLSYDGHKGTDFRLADMKAMKEGVAVLAAADGKVARLRDGMEDITIRDQAAGSVEGRECGNGIVIRHRGGFETQYCHLKQGSLLVKEGDAVSRHQPIAQIGMSGNTEFPHLHFQVTNKDGQILDPFSGVMGEEACGREDRESWWAPQSRPALAYGDSVILGSGFYSAPLTPEQAYSGEMKLQEIPQDADAIIFWAVLMGTQDQDVLVMQLVSPDGEVMVNHASKIDGDKAQYFQFVGQKAPRSREWPAGEYQAVVQLMRGPDKLQQVVVEQKGTVVVPAPEEAPDAATGDAEALP